MTRPSDAEVLREARRVLRVLAANDARLVRHGAETFAIRSTGDEDTKSLRIAAPLVAELRKRGWLSPVSAQRETYALSDTGLGWHLRDAAREDPFGSQHRVLASVVAKTDRGERAVTVNEAESPLGWLRQRGAVDAAQFAAGERLRRDFHMAQLMPRLGFNYSPAATVGKHGAPPETNLTDAVLAAKRRFSGALKAVGPGLADLLFDVCCHLQGLEDAERANGWPRRSAKVVLSIALDRLAAHYGLAGHAPVQGRVRSWAMDETFPA